MEFEDKGVDDLELTEVQQAALYWLVRYYRGEADRCRSVRTYLAGCAMAAAALEGILLLMANAYPEEAVATDQVPQRKQRVKPLVDWTLSELVRVARSAAWLPAGLERTEDCDHQRAEVGD
jgi:hypothetical protein